MKPLFAALLALAGAWALVSPATAAPAALDPFDEARLMGRGVNILGWDPVWTDPSAGRFQPRHFAMIRKAGFSTVRMNLMANAHMDADNRIDPAWLATLDRMVRAATDAGLQVIVDDHDYAPCDEDVAACEVKLTAFWRQVGARYADAPASVIFEVLNEPHAKLDDAAWNRLFAVELAEIRKTNPERNVVVGPSSWNSLDRLEGLSLPEADRHLIVTIHYYTPMEFTHQGASWVPQYAKFIGTTWGAPADHDRLAKDFDKAQSWAKEHGRPILLGEFGAYDKAGMDSRVRYTSAVARAAEARGWPWAYWQFDSDFIVFDMKKDAWVEPIRQALIPAS